MNYKLSVYADRIKGKCGYVIMADGSILSEKIVHFKGDNIKENILSTLYTGLLACRGLVAHDNVLTIEVQNSHLYRWLNGLAENDGYNEYLDKVFGVLETLDCKYIYYYTSKPFAKSYIASRDFTKSKVSSVEDMMADFV